MTESSSSSSSSDDDIDFYIPEESNEYAALTELCRTWADIRMLAGITNREEGELAERQFRSYVETVAPDLAEAIKKDGTVYEAVLLDWAAGRRVD